VPVAEGFSGCDEGWDALPVKEPTEERKFLRMTGVAIRPDGYAPVLYRIFHLYNAAAFVRSLGAPLRRPAEARGASLLRLATDRATDPIASRHREGPEAGTMSVLRNPRCPHSNASRPRDTCRPTQSHPSRRKTYRCLNRKFAG